MSNSLSVAASNDFPEPSAKHGLTVGERLVMAQLQLQRATQELAALKAEFAQAHDFGEYEENGAKILVIHNRTLDKKAAAQRFGDRDIFEPTVTAAALKNALTGSEYDSLLKEGDPTVSVRF